MRRDTIHYGYKNGPEDVDVNEVQVCGSMATKANWDRSPNFVAS